MRLVGAVRRSAFSMACWLSLAVGSAAQTDFARPIFETGGAAVAFAYGDMNSDGRPDAVVVHPSTDKLGIVLAKPGGSFHLPTLFSVGDEPRAVAIADFDLDARPDVVTFNENAGKLSLVLMKSTGTVISHWTAGGNGDLLGVGDLDHDGDPDVVTGNFTQKTLSVIAGLGPAGLAAPVTLPAGTTPRELVLRDLDGDGSLDVALQGTNPQCLRLWLGDGSGGLLAPMTLATAPAGTGYGGLLAGDFDVDGDVDLLTGGTTSLTLLRNGPGGFAAPELTPVGDNVTPEAATDFDGDGLLDLLVNTEAVGDGSGNVLAWMPGASGGSFTAPVELLGTGLNELVVDDVDDDQRADVLALLDGLCLLRSDGEGALLSHSPAVALAEQASLYALADLDGDGVDDLVSAAAEDDITFSVAGPVSVQLGDGAGGWGAPQLQSIEAVDFIELADVTGDGELDLVTTHGFSAHALRISAGDGAGGFATPSDVSLPSQRARSLESADLDADGDIDLAVLSSVQGFMGVEDRYILGFRNDGGGQWTSFAQYYGAAGLMGPEDHFALGDCNGDDLPDAVILDRFSDSVRFSPGGGGQFGGTAPIGSASPVAGHHALALGDVDGDRALDLFVAGTTVQLFRGHGDGTFDAPLTLGTGLGDDVQFADIDGDGSTDVVMDESAGSTTNVVAVWHANGLGGLVRNRYYSEAVHTSFVTDADQDGRLDLLTLPAWDGFSNPEPGDGHLLRNHALEAAFTDFGHGLAGSFGVPSLTGQGTLKAGSPGTLKLTGANPNKLAVLFIGPTANPTPFKGGMLVPIPPTIMFTLFTSPTGSITVGWSSWKLMPPGTDWFFQYGIVDVAGPAGASLSNAVRALQP